jgi:hypothetical protein
VGKLAAIPHLKAVRALEKGGFLIVRQGKHIVVSDGEVFSRSHALIR